MKSKYIVLFDNNKREFNNIDKATEFYGEVYKIANKLILKDKNNKIICYKAKE